MKFKRLEIPPHIAWPALVILLLLLGMGNAFYALYAAHSDGGAIIISDPVEDATAPHD